MQLKKTLIFLICLAFLTSAAWGVSTQTGKVQSIKTALSIDTDTYLDINEWLCFVYNQGHYAYDNANVLGKTDGGYFPRGTKKSVIYAAGLWIGAKVEGQKRVAVAEFSSEYAPGPMAGGTFQTDRPAFRVYKIARGDTPESNPDYADWPVDQGAPVDDEGNPALLGDQMTWSVFNDANPARHNVGAGNTEPLGLEIQQSLFAYGRTGALGKVVFNRYLIINKGGNTLEDTYISLWCDPDLGNSSDDLVGCDTVLSLGFCYNDGSDAIYGDAPPAAGFDFFQGPIIETGNMDDSAKFKGEWIYGYVNLPMTSFNKYINGTDPESFEETYNYMQGLDPDGADVEDPFGNVTKFSVAGDPVSGTGWIDEASADRRYMMSTGPFTMEPGDTQEVVAAILVGQGSNPTNSITALKTVDALAQTVFDLNFDIPSPPPNPSSWARGYDGWVELTWGREPEEHYQDYREKTKEFFIFEGYNVYQGESPSGPWQKIAVYDYLAGESQAIFEPFAGENVVLCNADSSVCDTFPRDWKFEKIYNDILNTEAGEAEKLIVQAGSESGLVNHFTVDHDYITGGDLINHHPYYFAITPYSVNIQEISSADSVFTAGKFTGYEMATLENVIIPLTVVPKGSGAILIDTAEHASGPSQGNVIIEYLYYDGTEPETYTVDFNATDPVTWNLKKGTQVLLADQENQGGGYDYEIVDGLMIRVLGPDYDIAPSANSVTGGVIEIQNADGPVDPPDNVFWSLNSTADWYVGSNLDGSSYAARARFNRLGLIGWESWEIRFTEEGSEYFDYNSFAKMDNRAPFEIWHYSEDATEPDRRDMFEFIDNDASGDWTYGDLVYVVEQEYVEPLPASTPGIWPDEYHLHRVKFIDYSGATTAPAVGTIVRFNSTVPNSSADVFEFTTKPVGMQAGTVVADELDNVGVVPNPYYNYNILETDQFDRIIKFINLPPRRCTIRIFNIAGDLVREMVKEDLAAAEYVWDTQTENGLPVASGIYVWYIEAEGLGSTFGKLIVFTEVEQLNTY
jgi:hypothetical protein